MTQSRKPSEEPEDKNEAINTSFYSSLDALFPAILQSDDKINIRENYTHTTDEVNDIAESLSQTSVKENEIERQYAVQRHFFNPARAVKSETKRLANKLLQYRLVEDSTSRFVLDVSGMITRRVITAERAAIDASKKVSGEVQQQTRSRNKLGWVEGKKETVKLGTTEITYKHMPQHPNHLGNFYMIIPGTTSGDYEEILTILLALAKSSRTTPNKPKEQALANIMLAYAKKGKPIALNVLKNVNPSAIQSDCDKLNTICYLTFVKEVTRRMVCRDGVCEFPVAIMQARTMKLISRGFLSLSEVFSFDAPFGIVTGRNMTSNIADVQNKMERINKLYGEVIYKRHTPDTPSKQLHEELLNTYGGSSDTDGHGYTSDEKDEQSTNPSKRHKKT
jgi:hypothetical protein